MIGSIQAILAAVLAACSSPSTVGPGSIGHVPPEKDHYFCCDKLDKDSDKGSGSGCSEILESTVALCGKVLYCENGYLDDEGEVSCK